MSELDPKQAMDETSFLDFVSKVDFDSFSNDASRRKALGASRALARRLETPVDSIWTMMIQYPALYSALKVALDLKIFAKLDQEGGRAKTTQELAGGAQVDVVRRMLRHLASMFFIGNPGPELWVPTRQSSALQRPEIFAGVDYLYDISGPAFMALPHFLRKTAYEDPTNVMDGNWQFATEPRKSHFEWMAERPEAQKTFWNLMTGYASEPGTWVDVFPTARIVADAKPDVPLIVDIGGAEGRDMRTFLDKHPEAVGKLVFQDQGPVIESAQVQRDHGLEPMVHDFFSPQPEKTKGARVYFMHRILHDWPDDQGRAILAHVKDAMNPDYSRLLINEIVLPRSQANWHQTSIDLMMMGLLSSRERSEDAWEEFLRSAGFRVVQFWQSLAAYENVIEVAVA